MRTHRRLPIVAFAFVLLGAGCGGSFELSRAASISSPTLGASGAPAPRDDAYCRQLDVSRRRYNACSIIGVSLTAGTGLASIPVGVEVRPYLIGAGVFTATAAAVCKFISDDLANEWIRGGCGSAP